MMRKIVGFVALLAFVGCTQKDEQGDAITFNLRAPNLPDNTTVYVVGSQPEIGMWNPGAIAMENMGNHTWTKTVRFDSIPGIEYKFTLGDWAHQAADENNMPLENFHILVQPGTIVTHTINNWTEEEIRVNHGQITGEVKYHKNMEGEGILPRDMIVWLPPGYEESEETYPVLYMHDGQNIIDPATSYNGWDWRVDEVCDSLIKDKQIPPLIVVGMNNTTNRAPEYGPNEMGKNYMEFVVNKVKPYIDSIYRTKPDRQNTLVGGSSMGGIISFRMAWEYPEVFSKAICMSPAFKINELDYVKNVKADKGEKKDIKLYIDNGGIGLELELQSGINDMFAEMNQQGYVSGVDYLWVNDKNAQHNEQAWAKRLPLALVWLFNEQ